MKLLLALILAAASALAGPPVICQRVDAGDGKSLPWRDVEGWDGAVRGYDIASLAADTLAILTPSAPVPLRMETIRRAAIYAARSEAAAQDLAARLLARAEAGAKNSAHAWFDAGYFAEALRQIGFVYRHDMLSAHEKANWKIRGDGATAIDGHPWIEKAIELGGKGMDVALANVRDYRTADRERMLSFAK